MTDPQPRFRKHEGSWGRDDDADASNDRLWFVICLIVAFAIGVVVGLPF